MSDFSSKQKFKLTCWFLKYNTVLYIPFYSKLFFFYYVVVYCFVFYYPTFATLYDAVLYFGNFGISRWPQESLFHSICCSPKGRIRFKSFDLAPLGFWFDTWAFVILGHFILLELYLSSSHIHIGSQEIDFGRTWQLRDKSCFVIFVFYLAGAG